jgi:zinc protease
MHEKVPFIGKSKAHRFTLPNGLKLIVVPTGTAEVFSYQTWYNVGSRDEAPGLSGIAHFFEHMMFKGTKRLKPGEFDRLMESNGARDLNAFTSTDYTAYVQSLPVEKLDLVAKLESERMTTLALAKKEFESEREVVHNERKQRTENSPEGLMFEELQKLAFQKHPYGRPVIGFAEDLDRMTMDDCKKFYKEYYAPNNAIIAVAGGVKPEKVFQIIKKHYGKIPASKIERIEIPTEPEQTAPRKKELKLSLQVEKAYVGYRVPSITHDDHIPLGVLATIMSTGRSSRLYQAMVDKGYTLDVGAGAGSSKDDNLFYVTFSVQAGKHADEAIQVLDGEINKLVNELVTEEELERAKTKLRVETFVGLDTNSAKAHFVGQFEAVLGDFEIAVKSMNQVNDVTREEVRNMARKYLREESRTMVIGLPQGASA